MTAIELSIVESLMKWVFVMVVVNVEVEKMAVHVAGWTNGVGSARIEGVLGGMLTLSLDVINVVPSNKRDAKKGGSLSPAKAHAVIQILCLKVQNLELMTFPGMDIPAPDSDRPAPTRWMQGPCAISRLS